MVLALIFISIIMTTLAWIDIAMRLNQINKRLYGQFKRIEDQYNSLHGLDDLDAKIAMVKRKMAKGAK